MQSAKSEALFRFEGLSESARRLGRVASAEL